MIRILFVGISMLLASSMWNRVVRAGEVEIIAHRGASYEFPENTIASLRAGFEQGCDAGELDVWMSRDGHPVVIHDKDTKRVTGAATLVSDLTLAELQALDAGKWKDARFTGEKIPTLVDCLAIIPTGKRMFVEIKCDVSCVPPILAAIEESSARPEQLEIISFNADVVAELKKRRPDLKAYWIVALSNKPGKETKVDDLVARALAIRADGLDLSWNPILDQNFVRSIRAAKLKLYTWTVNDPDVAKQLVKLGVDGITTDRPGWLREQLSAAGQ